jgi:hypothetical protein
MTRILKTSLLAVAFVAPLVFTPASLRADEKKYHDTAKNDDHEWNITKIALTAFGRKRTTANIGTSRPFEKKTANRIGDGVMNMMMPG